MLLVIDWILLCRCNLLHYISTCVHCLHQRGRSDCLLVIYVHKRYIASVVYRTPCGRSVALKLAPAESE